MGGKYKAIIPYKLATLDSVFVLEISFTLKLWTDFDSNITCMVANVRQYINLYFPEVLLFWSQSIVALH